MAEFRPVWEDTMRDAHPRAEVAMPKSGRRKRLWRAAILIGLALAVLAAVSVQGLGYQILGYRHYRIPSNSMAPTLKAGDQVRVEQGHRLEAPRRGEVWIFRGPPPAANTIVKRVIGLPGETVEVRGGQVWVDGKPLAEPHLGTLPSYSMAPRTLGPDEYWMLGDNRNLSADSHVWGPVPRDRLMGRVRMRVWPPKRFGGL
jgi:signal peptidase I